MDEIKKYEIRTWSGRYFEASDEAFRIMIVLYGGGDQQLGYLRFWENVNDMPENEGTDPPRIFNFPYQSYLPVIDLLRNEKPMYLSSLLGEVPCGMLSTTKEPVGEGETRSLFLQNLQKSPVKV